MCYAGGGITQHIRQTSRCENWPTSRDTRCACRASDLVEDVCRSRNVSGTYCLNEVYNAIQSVIAPGHEAAGVEGMKFFYRR